MNLKEEFFQISLLPSRIITSLNLSEGYEVTESTKGVDNFFSAFALAYNQLAIPDKKNMSIKLLRELCEQQYKQPSSKSFVDDRNKSKSGRREQDAQNQSERFRLYKK